MDRYRVTELGLTRWRAKDGQSAVDVWCALHNLDPNEVPVGVEIQGEAITGAVYLKDEEGHRYFTPGTREPATAPFTRQLIERPPPYALEAVA